MIRFDYNIHKKQSIIGIDVSYGKDFKAFYLHFLIWSVGFYKAQ